MTSSSISTIWLIATILSPLSSSVFPSYPLLNLYLMTAVDNGYHALLQELLQHLLDYQHCPIDFVRAECEHESRMSETLRGSYVYNNSSAAARHIQQHFPSVYLCTYSIVSLLWASHSCCAAIHLLTHVAFLSLCSALFVLPSHSLTHPRSHLMFVSLSFFNLLFVSVCLSNYNLPCHFLFVLLFSSVFLSRFLCLFGSNSFTQSESQVAVTLATLWP